MRRLHSGNTGLWLAAALLLAALGCDSGTEEDPVLGAGTGGGGGSGASPASGGGTSGSSGSGTSGGTSGAPAGGSGGTTVVDPGCVIDDADDCDGAINAVDGREGYWYSYNSSCDGTSGSQTPAAPCAAVSSDVFPATPAGDGCEIRTSGSGFPDTDGYAGIGFEFASGSGTLDACAYDGVQVTITGSPVRMGVGTTATNVDYDHYGVELLAGTRLIHWDQLLQGGWGATQFFDCHEVTGFYFDPQDPSSFDYAVDDLAFIGGDCGSGSTGTGGSGGTSGNLTWQLANLTWYESYPDPNSDECLYFSGCEYVGQFAMWPGETRPESWVQATNIAAVHSRDWYTYQGKTLRVRQDGREIDVVIYDQCVDTDCGGCCTNNASETGFLIDMEINTADRFGSSAGVVEWACLDC